MIRSDELHLRLPAALATAATALFLAAPAAYAQLPPNNGGVDQYVAPVPDSRGDRPANPRHEGGDPSDLPPRVRGSLPPGSVGALLARLATDPGSGAPLGSGDGDSDGSGGGGAGGSGGGGSSGGGLGDLNSPTTSAAKEKHVTAASAITSSISDDPAVAVVVLAVLALTLALGAIGIARRRRGT